MTFCTPIVNVSFLEMVTFISQSNFSESIALIKDIEAAKGKYVFDASLETAKEFHWKA